ncbi:hypothetical protein BBC27_09680 [Acidithiobacillus ferrivorans]|uniref:Uncharacterized protein n=1 Tax=Acidithiobacillus ferrivorans TaxID=160808 RepID=A0A1B9BZF8_9PROT|nr:hypothetical protein [Acidithiobacillus ferrivorans]OCB03109.1 hypothetical protein BBC27_09680 [Acidithiobacillus ferrivorans]
MNATRQEELKALLKELRGWGTGADFILSQDGEIGNYHAVMWHINYTMSYLMDNLMSPIIHMVAGADAQTTMDDMPPHRYPPMGISREDFISHLLLDIEDWVDTNMELIDADFGAAMIAMSSADYDDADGNSIMILQEIIHTIKRMVDDYFSGGRHPGERWFVSFRELSQDDRGWLESVNNRINHGEKRFLTQPEIDRLGSMIAFDSPGTLADLLSKAWS